MKKLSYFLVTLLCASSLVACGGGGGKETTAATTTTATTDKPSEPSAEAGAGNITIAVAHTVADTEESHYHQFLMKMVEELDERSQGTIKLDIHANGELGGEREAIEAVGLGTLDATITGAGPLGNFASKSNALDFPFLFRDREHAYAVLDGELGDEISEQLRESNLEVIVWAENGFRNMTNVKHPIITPDDLKGIKIRTQENQIHLQAFTDFGAAPTPMSFTELFSAMQQGVVDGQENPLAVIVPNKFYEVQKYITMSEHFYQAAPLIINKKLWESFSSEQQQIIKDAAAVARDHEREFIAMQEEEYLQKLEDNGMEVIGKNDYDRDAFVKASEHVYEKYKDEYGEFIQRIKDTK
ncbi:DctP family TRAP transporter solute-binding subunit [bacterium LRH843]|nr:DctP family TRAP transporter solute-binding subunit [bacterium LRH843]